MEDLLYLENYYFDLQLFASPEDEGRTEEPSERKRRKAREEGNVAKSPDLISAAIFLFSFWVFWLTAQFIFLSLKNFMAGVFRNLDTPLSWNNIGAYTVAFSLEFWKIIGPALLAGIFIGVLANVLQVGVMFTTKPIEPKFHKITFTLKKLKEKMFSKTSFRT